MTRIIIDTDAGVDDALAIIYASQSPGLQIDLITTVSGNVPVAQVTRNVLLLRDLLQLNIPVRSGAPRPLKRRLVTAPEVHGRDGLGGYRESTNKRFSSWKTGDAAEFIVDAALRLGRELTIVSIGPMTNIAEAIALNADAMRRIGGIVQMGGSFFGYGNTTTFTEFNIFVDPDAADFVLGSGVTLKFVPLDLTEKIFMPRKILLSLLNSSWKMKGEIKKFMRQSTSFYIDYHRTADNLDGCFLHDPLAVAAALNPQWFKFVPSYVRVETAGELTVGMTVADFRKKSRKTNCQIAVVAKPMRFLHDFTRRVFGLDLPTRLTKKDFLAQRFQPKFGGVTGKQN